MLCGALENTQQFQVSDIEMRVLLPLTVLASKNWAGFLLLSQKAIKIRLLELVINAMLTLFFSFVLIVFSSSFVMYPGPWRYKCRRSSRQTFSVLVD